MGKSRKHVMTARELTALNRAISLGGGIVKFAKRLKTTTSVVQNWRTRGVPGKRCRAIEKITHVTCEALRPDLYAN